jgi:hypothetical protein
MSLLELCQWIQDTQISTAIRESIWVYPIILSVHLLALGTSVGTLLWFDLRLLGWLMRSQPVSDVYRAVLPWMAIGFLVMFASGGLLFAALAAKCYGNTVFRIKLVAIAVAGINALIFHLVTRRSIADWDKAAVPPLGARLAGLLSIVCWMVTMGAGRRIVAGLQ